jgi:hypothetical protein
LRHFIDTQNGAELAFLAPQGCGADQSATQSEYACI